MHDTTQQHHRRSRRRSLVYRILHGVLPRPRFLDAYTQHQERVRAERRHERKRQKIASLLRGVIVLLIALLIAFAIARESGPHASTGDNANPYQSEVTAPPSSGASSP